MSQRPEPIQCPVCASPDYIKVKVELPDGESYGVDVYRCALCSFKFLNRSRPPAYTERPASEHKYVA